MAVLGLPWGRSEVAFGGDTFWADFSKAAVTSWADFSTMAGIGRLGLDLGYRAF